MKMKNAIIAILLILFIQGCSNKQKKNKEGFFSADKDKIVLGCLQSEDIESIAEEILNTPKLQIHVIPLKERSIEIQLLKNDLITQDLSIKVGGIPVVLNDSTNKTEHTFRIKALNVNCEKQKLSFSVWYPFEHVVIRGEAIKKHKKWSVQITGSGAID